jgi:hypothetical protein
LSAEAPWIEDLFVRGAFELAFGEYGPRAVLTQPWNACTLRQLKKHKVVELELNMAKGWGGHDIAFVAEFPELQAFEILDLHIPSVAPIHSLHQLRRLKVITYCPTEIRFGAFPALEICNLEWRAGAKSVFECTSLKDLFINRYEGRDSSVFGTLRNLEDLGVLNSPLGELRGLAPLTKLRKLRLNNLSRLTSLSGLERLTSLEELNIEGCRKVHSIAEVGSLPRLKGLHFGGNAEIESLAPLKLHNALESVSFWGSTKIVDGDLSPLASLPKLTYVAFQNRRHYTHRHEDFGTYWLE